VTWTSAGERETLEGFVDLQRDELVLLLADVDEAEARARLVPSLTTVLGLVKHAAFAERVWFHSRVAGVARSELGIPDTVDESFTLTPADTIDSVRSDFLAACQRSREICAEHQLHEQFESRHGPVSLRWIYGHMIEELARHAGHADILVEQIKAARSVSSAPEGLGSDSPAHDGPAASIAP
jgi:hypothetical protein